MVETEEDRSLGRSAGSCGEGGRRGGRGGERGEGGGWGAHSRVAGRAHE